MPKRFLVLFAGIGLVVSATAQEIPPQLRGTWVVKQELPTTAISCWGESDARKMIGTEIEYTADSFRWKDVVTNHPSMEIHVVSAEQFHCFFGMRTLLRGPTAVYAAKESKIAYSRRKRFARSNSSRSAGVRRFSRR